MADRPERHLWVRMGGAAFCGKRGCGVLMSGPERDKPCKGEESPGIKMLRNERDQGGEN